MHLLTPCTFCQGANGALSTHYGEEGGCTAWEQAGLCRVPVKGPQPCSVHTHCKALTANVNCSHLTSKLSVCLGMAND